jgi:hypothetical protein
LADKRLELGGRAADGERPGSGDGRDRTPDQGGVKCLGDDREVGQFRHGRPIVAARNRVLDSPGSGRQHS